MTIRIPILEQDSRASFAPMGPVDAVQIADPRGKALQGFGDTLGQVGDVLAKDNARNKDNGQTKALTDQVKADLDDYAANPIDYSLGSDPTRFKYQQDSRAWTMQTYAQCVSQAADLGTQLTAQGQGGADAPAGNLFDYLRTPALQQAFGGALPAFGAASPSGASPAGTAASSVSGAPREPNPTDVATHGLTGAWVNGYDLIAQRSLGAASDPAVARRIAEQCQLDRASGRLNIMSFEALRNVQQREDGYLASVQTVADKRLAADPGALGEMLAFAKANMIRVDPHRQAGFEAKVDNILIDAAMNTAISRDPRGLVLALEHRAGVKEEGSDASGNAGSVTSTPEDHLAEHPVTSALSPEQAKAWLPRANAALETARSTARVSTLQASDAALRQYRDTGSAANAPDEAQLVGILGLERGQQMYAQLQEARSEGNHYVNLRPLPSAALRDMRAQEGVDEAGQDTVPSARVTPAQRAIDRILRERQRNPMQAAFDAGGYGLNVLDLSNAQTAQQGVLARITPSREVAGNYGGRRDLLAAAESPKLAGVIQALPPKEQAQWLRDLMAGAGDDDAVQAVLRQLSPHAPALAQAGRLLLEDQARNAANDGDQRDWGGSGEIDAATQILNGAARISAGDAGLPPDAEIRRAFRISMGETYADQPGEEAMRYEAMRAAYAGLSEREGDASGKFDRRRWDAAVKLVSFGNGTEREVGLVGKESAFSEPDLGEPPNRAAKTSAMSSANPLNSLDPRKDIAQFSAESAHKDDVSDIAARATRPSLLQEDQAVGNDQSDRRKNFENQYAYNEMSGLPIPDVGAGARSTESTREPNNENGPLRPGFLSDGKHEYPLRVMRNIAHPPPGTSNTAISEFPKRNSSEIKKLIAAGPGSTSFGNVQSGQIRKKGFDVPLLPEQYTENPNDPTHHEYGVLTYLGKADTQKGVSKDAVVELLVGRRTRPGYQLRPVPPAFSVYNNVYATDPGLTITDHLIGDDDYVMKKENYTHEIGSIAQVRVPDGIVNITATDHKSYPGTIRRTILEVDGHLFVYTQGSGENRAENKPIVDPSSIGPTSIPKRFLRDAEPGGEMARLVRKRLRWSTKVFLRMSSVCARGCRWNQWT